MDYLDLVFSGKASSVKELSGGYHHKELAERVLCKDGTKLSVQGSETHYCSPRENYGGYYAMEVGFPTVEPPETWREYIDGNWDELDRTKTVYGYVPIEMIREYVESHGGCIND